ncbi:MAG: OmpA family protein [Bryobacteraceae bacterium]
MKHGYAITVVMSGMLLAGGCATKKYVRNTADPIRGKLDQVADQTNKQGATLDKQGTTLEATRKDIERDETELNATKERAMSAESRATDALGRADQAGQKADAAGQKADKNTHDLGDLRQMVANLDDYKVAAEVTVPFGFNKDNLTPPAKAQLDKLVADKNTLKRYFIAVEGFTDKTGSMSYNEGLSRRRADRVVQYLVAKHDIPIFRIHMVGLGEQKLADPGRSRGARAKNRRVEVTVYSADPSVTAMNQPSGARPPVTNR